jgi:histidyl-tRNA synthetase
MGLDRIALMLEADFQSVPQAQIYIASVGNQARSFALMLAEDIRDDCPARRVVVNCGEGKFKSQLKKADSSGASLALILGEDEIASGQVTVKHLRESGEQKSINTEELGLYLADFFTKE